MFKKASAVAVLAVLALSGCSAAVSEDAAQSDDVAAVEATPSSTPAPIVVTPEPAESTDPGSGKIEDGDAVFLNYARPLTFGLDSVTDALLIAAGEFACDQMDAGLDRADIVAIEGQTGSEPTPGTNNAMVINVAAETLCVQHSVPLSVID